MKKQTLIKLITAFLSLPLVVGCSQGSKTYSKPTPTSSYTPSFNPEEKIDAAKVYDSFIDDGYPETLSFTVKEISSRPFSIRDDEILDADGNSFAKVGRALYLYDANGDGYRDFCFTEQANTSVWRTYLRVYDYKNKKEIFNNYRTYTNVYGLYFELKDKELKVFRTNSRYNDERYGEGKLVYSGGVVDIKWDNYFNLANLDISLTYADPNHTPITVTKQGDKYIYGVDKVSKYLLNVETTETPKTVYPETMYTSVSFTPSGEGISITNSTSPFLYMFSFTEKLNNSSIKIEFSGFEKTLVFNLLDDSTCPFNRPTLGELINWPNDNTTISEINIKEEVPGTNASDGNYGIGTFYSFTDATYLSSVTCAFDEKLFEIDSNNFLFASWRHNTYVIKTNLGDFAFVFVGEYLFLNNKYYAHNQTIVNIDKNKADTKTYFFDSDVESLEVNAVVPGENSVVINNPGDFVFTKKLASQETGLNITHTFEIRGTSYYIVGKKKFLDTNRRYVFEIISEADFSSLFNDQL